MVAQDVRTGSESPRTVLHRLATGDLSALEVIYDDHIEAAWKVALLGAADEPAAEEAVSAAFLGLWRRPDPSDPASLRARLLASVWREASRRDRRGGERA